MPIFEAVVGGEGALEPGSVPFLEVPADVVSSLGGGKRPKVSVTVNGHTFRSTVAVYSGRFYLPLNRENRSAARVDLGDRVRVALEPDTAPREVVIPERLAAALRARPGAREAFDGLAYTLRKEHAESVSSAKQAETADRRIRKILDRLPG